MKKVLTVIAASFIAFTTTSYAHITNENTIYEDVEYSQAKEQLVALRSINAIGYESGANVFEPQKKLTKLDLAFHVSTFYALGGDEEESTLTKEQTAQLAVDKGYVDSLEGNATYQDVNKAYFDGKIDLKEEKKELTKEEFVFFLTYDLKDLLTKAHVTEGPTGTVDSVKVAGEEEITFVVDGKSYAFYGHGKVINGPVDLTQWKGKKIGESYLKDNALILVKADEKIAPLPQTEKDKIDALLVQKTVEKSTNAVKETKKEEKTTKTDEKEEKGFPIAPVVGVIVVVLLVVFFVGRKKK